MQQAPPKPPPPKPGPPSPLSNGGKAAMPIAKRTFSVCSGVRADYQRVVLYGPGGVGKSELAASIKQSGVKPLFIDIGKGSQFLDVDRIDDIETWEELRAVLHDETLWKNYGAVVLDDLTKAQELDEAWVVKNIPHDKPGRFVTSLESYGYGKGTTHAYESFLPLLGDLDQHIRQQRHVICIAHECTSRVPNPAGDNWIRYEPRLQSPESGKNSIRLRIKEWADHLLFVGYDVFVSEDGKGQGSGTRTIHPVELPTHMAKSRSLTSPIPYQRGSAELWKQLFGGN